MISRTFVPPATASPNPITLPDDAPSIDVVVSAQIIRLPSAISAHAAHLHTINLAADAGAANLVETAGVLGVAGGAAGVTGIQNATVSAHTGANPVVAASPVKDTARTFHLAGGVNTLDGDLLTINYRELGERIGTS